jgi:Flp pilus assembly protein TadG
MAPLIFLVLFGIMEGGRVISAWLVITSEAREAARYGAVRFGTADLETQVETYIDQRLFGDSATRRDDVLARSGLTPEPSVTIDEITRRVTVTIYYKVDLVIPIVRDVLPNPFPLAARSSMRGE